jgi:hypothetical protein
MERKRLVLDANILIRGCFGRRVRLILANHADQADFFVAQVAVSEVGRYVLDLARRRGLDEAVCQEALQSLLNVVQVVDDEWLAHAEMWASAVARAQGNTLSARAFRRRSLLIRLAASRRARAR